MFVMFAISLMDVGILTHGVSTVRCMPTGSHTWHVSFSSTDSIQVVCRWMFQAHLRSLETDQSSWLIVDVIFHVLLSVDPCFNVNQLQLEFISSIS